MTETKMPGAVVVSPCKPWHAGEHEAAFRARAAAENLGGPPAEEFAAGVAASPQFREHD